MNAFETVKEIIKNRVAIINLAAESGCNAETYERFRHELTGMMICLKNICETERFYSLNYCENGVVEFGYYDESGVWVVEQ